MSFAEEYCHLHKLGVTADLLFMVVDDSDDDLAAHGLNVEAITVTNETVLQLYKFMKSNSVCTFYSLWRWLACFYGSFWPKEAFPTVYAVRLSTLRLSDKYGKLKNMPASVEKIRAISDFLNSPFVLPNSFPPKFAAQAVSSNSSSESCVSASISCSSCSEKDILITDKSNKIHALQEENQLLQEADSQKLAETRKKMHSVHRNLTKKLHRRDNEDKKVINQLQHEVSHSQSQLNKMKLKFDRVRHRFTYWKSKYDQAVQMRDDCECEEGDVFYTKLKEEIGSLEDKNVKLQETRRVNGCIKRMKLLLLIKENT